MFTFLIVEYYDWMAESVWAAYTFWELFHICIVLQFADLEINTHVVKSNFPIVCTMQHKSLFSHKYMSVAASECGSQSTK